MTNTNSQSQTAKSSTYSRIARSALALLFVAAVIPMTGCAVDESDDADYGQDTQQIDEREVSDPASAHRALDDADELNDPTVIVDAGELDETTVRIDTDVLTDSAAPADSLEQADPNANTQAQPAMDVDQYDAQHDQYDGEGAEPELQDPNYRPFPRKTDEMAQKTGRDAVPGPVIDQPYDPTR